ncbi:hypothetical protein BS78_03G306500 [Paspalum vaginatum]|nr:hypothetical protein BS78_03G306500 [Paspalum vaginatum]
MPSLGRPGHRPPRVQRSRPPCPAASPAPHPRSIPHVPYSQFHRRRPPQCTQRGHLRFLGAPFVLPPTPQAPPLGPIPLRLARCRVHPQAALQRRLPPTPPPPPPLLSHFHGHLLRSNLLAYSHVASSLLRSYSLLSPHAAHQLFDQIAPGTRSLYVFNVMLASLCRSSDLGSARAFFDSIPGKDVVSCSTMLACYFSRGRLADGLALFRTVTFAMDIAVDCFMLADLLMACASAGSLAPFCRAIHGYIMRHTIPASMHLGSALIDCYIKADRLDYVARVFARVPNRDVKHWTSMIYVMSSHLCYNEAVQLFEEMCQSGVQPIDEKAFTAVLSACADAGLVEKGREFFKLMVDRYCLEPDIYHYGCMVDLYAKAGMLEDAYEVIETMKLEPNVIIWTSLLAACKKFKNFDIADKGLEKSWHCRYLMKALDYIC